MLRTGFTVNVVEPSSVNDASSTPFTPSFAPVVSTMLSSGTYDCYRYLLPLGTKAVSFSSASEYESVDDSF